MIFQKNYRKIKKLLSDDIIMSSLNASNFMIILKNNIVIKQNKMENPSILVGGKKFLFKKKEIKDFREFRRFLKFVKYQIQELG